MVKAAVSDFKAKLSSYLRLVKSGEQIEIQDRGLTVAVLSGLPHEEEQLVIPASKSPKIFSKTQARVTLKGADPIQILFEDRKKR